MPRSEPKNNGLAKGENFVTKNEDDDRGDAKASLREETRFAVEIFSFSAARIDNDIFGLRSNYMSKVIEKLGKIFGSPARVKILRLFLFNPETPYDPAEISERSNVSRSEARREAESLLHAGFLKKRQYIKEIKSRKTIKRKKAKGYVLDTEFSMNEPLKTLLIESELVRVDDLPNRFRHAGKIALFVASGIFMRDKDRQLDILIVGNRLRRPSVDRAVKMLESEIGKEIRYAVFDLEEFNYRLRMYDKLIRDVFDYPHRRLIQKIDIGEK